MVSHKKQAQNLCITAWVKQSQTKLNISSKFKHSWIELNAKNQTIEKVKRESYTVNPVKTWLSTGCFKKNGRIEFVLYLGNQETDF